MLLRTLIEEKFNLSSAAARLGLSQPSASRRLQTLELESGAPLVIRQGRRITGLTDLGMQLTIPIRDMATSLSHLDAIIDSYHGRRKTELSIATTHSQARYFLPPVISEFRKIYPDVRVLFRQSMPAEIARLVREGHVDLGVCTDRISTDNELQFSPGYQWSHAVCAPKNHPFYANPITLSDLGNFPVLTYVTGITGRQIMEAYLAERGVALDIALEAADTDVLKTFIRQGLGYGLICSMAYEPKNDSDLRLRRIEGAPVLKMGIASRRGAYLSSPARAMISMIRKASVGFEQQISEQQI